jgi:hypothetical protein
MAVAFADGHAQIFKYGQSTEKLVDLESARETSSRTLRLARCGDVVATEENATGVRLEHAGDQIDQSRLPGPVGADQRPACAAFKRKIDIPRYRQCTETAVQFLDLQRGGHDRFLSAR